MEKPLRLAAGFVIALSAAACAVADASAQAYRSAGVTCTKDELDGYPYTDAAQCDAQKQFLLWLQREVAADHAAAVAAEIEFPIDIRIYEDGMDGPHKDLVFGTAQGFVSRWAELFTPHMKRVIAGETYANAFVSWRGVGLGQGDLFYSGICRNKSCSQSDIKIYSLAVHATPRRDLDRVPAAPAARQLVARTSPAPSQAPQQAQASPSAGTTDTSVRGQGLAYARQSGTQWTLERKLDPMTDKEVLRAISRQSSAEGTAVLVGQCDGQSVVFDTSVYSPTGRPTRLANANAQGGALSRFRVNADEPRMQLIAALDKANEITLFMLVSPQDREAKTKQALIQAITNTRPLMVGDVWRVLVELVLETGTIVARVPVFDDSIQELINACAGAKP